MNAESNSSNLSESAQMRLLKLCNGFWYFVCIMAMGLIAIVLMRWELYVHNRVILVMYLCAPVLLVGMSVVMLKVVTSSQRLNLTLLMVAVMSSIYLMETYLAFNSDIDIRAIKALTSGITVDERYKKKSVVEELRNEGLQAYPTIHPAHLLKKSKSNDRHSILKIGDQEVLPFGGVASATTVYNRESGQWVIYESDEYGFRNPIGIWNNSDFNLAVVGDSFAHGAGLLEGEDIVSLMRTSFPTSVNLGNGGNGPLMAFGTLREYGSKLKPRFVVYFYYEDNDLHNLSREKQVPLLMRYLREESWSQNLYEQQDTINTMLQEFGEKQVRKYYVEDRLAWLREIFTLSRLRARVGLNLGKKVGSREWQPDLALFETILQQSRREVQGWGGTYVVAYLPAWERYKNPNYHMYRKEVLDILKINEIPIVDLHPVFQKKPDVFSLFHFGLNGHYNGDGAALVADEVRQKLESLSRNQKES